MFETLDALTPDPILGLSVAYRNDPNPDKIDLGVGVFKDAAGTTPIMRAVKDAEAIYLKSETTKVYTPPEGYPGFIDGVRDMVFSNQHDALQRGRISGVQTPGGCGALRLGAELLVKRGTKNLHVGAPTWGNHMPLLSTAGLTIKTAPYYDKTTTKLLFSDFRDYLKTLGPEDVVLYHGACHNPTGADFTAQQWDEIIDITADRGFLPFVDTAYHGFAVSLEDDVAPIRKLAEIVPEMLVSYSCSKNFGLYRERTGAIFVMGQSADHAQAAKSHLEFLARTSYSMPPAHGGALVATILASDELTQLWQDELVAMRYNVKNKRAMLAQTANQSNLGSVFDYIAAQNGMFSLLPVSPEQAGMLKDKHSVYLTSGGRVNMCGFSPENIDKFCQAYRSVL